MHLTGLQVILTGLFAFIGWFIPVIKGLTTIARILTAISALDIVRKGFCKI